MLASMTTNVLALFPGQGSQRVGMGKQLFERYALARQIFEQADQVLDLPLSKYCFEGPEEKLTQTAIAQPAILTVSTICYQLFAERNNKDQIAAAAGHSLGEYSALVAASALTFQDAVLLVHKRGRFMQESVPLGAGKMYAVMGKSVEELEAALAQVKQGVAEIANINSPGQIVVAGDVQGLNSFLEILGKAKTVELPVSAPFHCSLMKPAEQKLRAELAKISFSAPSFPIISNFHAKALSAPADIQEALGLQVCGRVRWLESMQLAASSFTSNSAIEFGEGNVLSNMLKRINPELARRQVGTPEEIEAL